MSNFAFSFLSALVFASVGADEIDAGVRKQVRIVANGAIAPNMGPQSEHGTGRMQRPHDAVRRQVQRHDMKQMFDWSASEKVEIAYMMHAGLDCATGEGATALDADRPKPSGLTLTQCQSRCSSDERCDCVTFQNATGTCSMMLGCIPEQCSSASLSDLYVQNTIYVVDGVKYRRAGGWTCGESSGAIQIDSDESAKVNVTPTQCLRECNQDPGCSCTRYHRYYDMKCWRMKNCPSEGHRLHECDRTDRFDTYIRQLEVPSTPSPTVPSYEEFGTDVYCYRPGGITSTALTHRHAQTPAGSYASHAACQELCDSAGDLCQFYLWRHDEHALVKYVCATFYACDVTQPFKDGDGGHVWKKTTSHPPKEAANGFVNLGIGRCGVCNDETHEVGAMCADPPHNTFFGEASKCEERCSGDIQCFGYSATNKGDCYTYHAPNLRFGGDIVGWEGSHCHAKTCVTTNSCPICKDTDGWQNGHNFGCQAYQVHFCASGQVKPGSEAWMGELMNLPENNCCACGGGVFQ